MNDSLVKAFEILIIEYRNKIQILKQQKKIDESKGLQFKINSFSKTLKIIKSLDFEIKNGEHLKDIQGIGPGVIKRINELLQKGYIEEIKNTDINNNQFSNLMRISGIGPAKAKILLEKGMTLAKLEQNIGSADLKTYLTHHQIIGLKYLHDIEKRIPYDEITHMETYLKNVIKEISPDLDLVICGSYRRKQPTSGDIDVLLYSNKNINYLEKFITRLKNQKFLIAHLTEGGDTKYMGIAQYKLGIPCRIDIRYVKKEYLPSSILYFTGSGDFNKNMRVYANKKGFKLNEYGLYKMRSDKSQGLKMKLKTEKEIFEFLKIPYVEPKNRVPYYKFPKV